MSSRFDIGSADSLARAASTGAASPAVSTSVRVNPPKPEGPSFGQVLKGLGDETARGERMVQRALHAGGGGHEVSAAELIALQAGVYRYVEVVDLTSKLVDRATQGIKGVVQQGGGG